MEKNQVKFLYRKRITAITTSLIFLLVFSNSCSYHKTEQTKPFDQVRTLAGMNKELGEPFGIAVRKGEVFVSDGEKGQILKIQRDGNISVLTDKLDTPSQIAFDEKGDLIVADSGTHTIKKVRAGGEVELVAGIENKPGFRDGEAKNALFHAPIGVAFYGGKIFVADTYNDRIRVIEKGKVSTLAGEMQGFSDGENAKFSTPTGLAVWREGKILVADSANARIRVVEQNGKTWTLAGGGARGSRDGLFPEAEFVQPRAVTVDSKGAVYIADGNAIRAIGKRFFPVVETISNVARGFRDTKFKRAKFNRPSGLAADEKGNVFVADSENGLVRVFTGSGLGSKFAEKDFDKDQFTAEEFRKISPPRWTYDPPENKREIAGTLGEIRGKINDETSEAWFHNGLDIVGGYGETARFIRDEKVLSPNAVENFETVRELLRMPTLGYIHIRLGRSANGETFNDPRFKFSFDEDFKPNGVRIPRGAKFKAGEPIGTLNSYNHVHLVAGKSGREMNALAALILPGISDSREPTIKSISLFDENGSEIETKDQNQRIKLDGKIRVVAEAYDQMDGNADRRKLGLYKLGYQIFNEYGEPLKNFEKPKWTIKFDKTPDNKTIALAYAKGSQSNATGETVFRYIVTNEVSGNRGKEGFIDANEFKPGNYTLKIFAADFFGNTAIKDIEFTIIGNIE